MSLQAADAPRTPISVKPEDFFVERLGEADIESPLRNMRFVSDDDRVAYYSDVNIIEDLVKRGESIPSFEAAGPRRFLFHDPVWSRAGIVTCGGLCPGINDVIRSIVNTLWFSYGVRTIFGFRYGYRGLVPKYGHRPVELDPEAVDLIHENGGSILGSSRGPQDPLEMVRTLERMNVNLLFCIGGDGTLRGARAIAECARERGRNISIVGVPKTIDNDISFVDRTFGFETAVYMAAPIISCAHEEAKGAYNGIGLVKLMGRDSGFVAAAATLANSVVNFCLVPEVPFQLEGENGFLPALERRLLAKQHAVIVVAEGAGQDLFKDLPEQRDASGNILHHDIGLFLRERIDEYLTRRGVEHHIKYFDPSYQIRSVPARGTDAVFCLHLGENAVHAAMAGRTNMVVGQWHGHFTHVPIPLAVRQRRKIRPCEQLWQSVLAVNRQADYWDPGVPPGQDAEPAVCG